MVFNITTKERTYSDVKSPKEFMRIREKWRDYSPVIDAQRWDSKKQKWVHAGMQQFAWNKGGK